jgi:hypothetical protein
MGLVESSTARRNEVKWYEMIWLGIARIGSSGGCLGRRQTVWKYRSDAGGAAVHVPIQSSA